jgi:hypothetical protein
MPNKTGSSISARRQFLTNILPTGAFFCLGCNHLLALPDTLGGQQTPGQKSKFLENSGMSEDVWTFAYRLFIPVYQIMANDFGREKFLEMLKKASAENWSQKGSFLAKDIPKRDMKTYADWFVKVMSAAPFDKAFAFEVVEKSDKAFEVKFAECLPARIYHEMNAADIGYAFDCYPMTAFARAFNSKMRLANPKNLVKGDDVCILRYTLEA